MWNTLSIAKLMVPGLPGITNTTFPIPSSKHFTMLIFLSFFQFGIFYRLDHEPAINANCGGTKTFEMYLPGDFSSDAQFFVFVGVISFLGTMVSLAVYVFFSDMYMSEQKKAPMVVSQRKKLPSSLIIGKKTLSRISA